MRMGTSAFMRMGIFAFMGIHISENENICVICEACGDTFEVRRETAYEMWRAQDEEGIRVTCPICLYSDGASDAIEIGRESELEPPK